MLYFYVTVKENYRSVHPCHTCISDLNQTLDLEADKNYLEKLRDSLKLQKMEDIRFVFFTCQIKYCTGIILLNFFCTWQTTPFNSSFRSLDSELLWDPLLETLKRDARTVRALFRHDDADTNDAKEVKLVSEGFEKIDCSGLGSDCEYPSYRTLVTNFSVMNSVHVLRNLMYYLIGDSDAKLQNSSTCTTNGFEKTISRVQNKMKDIPQIVSGMYFVNLVLEFRCFSKVCFVIINRCSFQSKST